MATLAKATLIEVPGAESALENKEAPAEKGSHSSAEEIDLQGGWKCEAKDFYLNKDGEWTQDYPTHIKEPAENGETKQYAILKRNEKGSDTRKKFSLHSIIIQSSLIKKVLGKVFEGYEGITSELDRLEFAKPFEPFVHRWERFRTSRNFEADHETREHLNLLWSILMDELRITLATRDDLLSHGVITYEYLWTMFEPKTIVFTKRGEAKDERVMRVVNYEYDPWENEFNVSAKFVEWDGKKFGMESDSCKVSQYKGTKKITELAVYPLLYHEDSKGVQARCIKRARLWESYCKYSFKAYKGTATDSRCNRYNVDSRVIIDTAAFAKFNPNQRLYVGDLEDDSTYLALPFDNSKAEKSKLTPWQQMLCTNTLRGYSLKDKQWLNFQLAPIKEITWNDEAFGRLVLPDDTKDLVLAFAQSQIKREQKFDDVIQGKGKGVIMLLSGPPGVGKTLTAEAVAETMQVPLYMMAAGDLGTDPHGVENQLNMITKMTTKWKAVLLIDEADIYLEARSAHDLERNKLVSIFLRVLEYYEGFLFLTSNRVDNIDAAFESRIHLSLQYGELSYQSRRQVWMAFLADKASFSEDQIDFLAAIPLNGRQIKNILKTAQLLATSKDAELSFAHVKTITKLRAANACVPLKVAMSECPCVRRDSLA